MRRDPQFAAAVEAAKLDALGAVEQLIFERATSTLKRPVVSRGQVVGFDERWDTPLLLRLAERLDPAAWCVKKEFKGQVAHQHQNLHSGAALTIQPEDVLLLPEDDAKKLCELLARVGELKEATSGQRVLDVTPAGEAQEQRQIGN